MSKKLALAAIRDCLAGIYQDEDDAIRICDDSGLDTKTIDFADSSQNRWHNILKKAEQTEKIDSLIKVCFQDSESHKLENLYQDYLNADDDLIKIKEDFFSWQSLRWYLLSVGILIIAGIGIYYFLIPTNPPNIQLTRVEDPKVKIYLSKDETDLNIKAAEWQKEDSNRHVNVSLPYESPINQQTKQFTWKLTAPENTIIDGKFQMIKTNGEKRTLDPVENNRQHFLTLKIPECEKGDKLLAVILLSWEKGDNEPRFKEILEIISSEVSW